MEAKPVYPNIQLFVGVSPLPSFNGEYKYYVYEQNNSGGNFHNNENLGEYVIIAAKDTKDANKRAQKIGVYFNGVKNGHDCECCGNRWSRAWAEVGNDIPLLYDTQRPEAFLMSFDRYSKIVVHHADGTRETYQRINEKH
jgi:hypothetical protein